LQRKRNGHDNATTLAGSRLRPDGNRNSNHH
jgi:hypothetical protein